jgi:hypothetical protein
LPPSFTATSSVGSESAGFWLGVVAVVPVRVTATCPNFVVVEIAVPVGVFQRSRELQERGTPTTFGVGFGVGFGVVAGTILPPRGVERSEESGTATAATTAAAATMARVMRNR